MIPSIKQIQQRACEIWGIKLGDLCGPSTITEHVNPRHLAMFYCASLGFKKIVIERAFLKSNGNMAHIIRNHCEERFNRSDWEKWLLLNAAFAEPKIAEYGPNRELTEFIRNGRLAHPVEL